MEKDGGDRTKLRQFYANILLRSVMSNDYLVIRNIGDVYQNKCVERMLGDAVGNDDYQDYDTNIEKKRVIMSRGNFYACLCNHALNKGDAHSLAVTNAIIEQKEVSEMLGDAVTIVEDSSFVLREVPPMRKSVFGKKLLVDALGRGPHHMGSTAKLLDSDLFNNQIPDTVHIFNFAPRTKKECKTMWCRVRSAVLRKREGGD
jgi:hypothetical protein